MNAQTEGAIRRSLAAQGVAVNPGDDVSKIFSDLVAGKIATGIGHLEAMPVADPAHGKLVEVLKRVEQRLRTQPLGNAVGYDG